MEKVRRVPISVCTGPDQLVLSAGVAAGGDWATPILLDRPSRRAAAAARGRRVGRGRHRPRSLRAVHRGRGCQGGTVADRACTAREIAERNEHGVSLRIALQGGREALVLVSLPADDRVSLQLSAAGQPLRLALEWDRRSEERFVGLGARHCTQFDQGGESNSEPIVATPARTARRTCSPPAGSPRATALPRRGCSQVAGTESGFRPTPTARVSISRVSASRSPHGRGRAAARRAAVRSDARLAAASVLPADRVSGAACRNGATDSGRAVTSMSTRTMCSTTSTAFAATRSRLTRS